MCIVFGAIYMKYIKTKHHNVKDNDEQMENGDGPVDPPHEFWHHLRNSEAIEVANIEFVGRYGF